MSASVSAVFFHVQREACVIDPPIYQDALLLLSIITSAGQQGQVQTDTDTMISGHAVHWAFNLVQRQPIVSKG